jgi:hypothetical protein
MRWVTFLSLYLSISLSLCFFVSTSLLSSSKKCLSSRNWEIVLWCVDWLKTKNRLHHFTHVTNWREHASISFFAITTKWKIVMYVCVLCVFSVFSMFSVCVCVFSVCVCVCVLCVD